MSQRVSAAVCGAERERDVDRIHIAALEEALSEGLEVLEDYPEDPRGHSHLVLSFTQAMEPIHAVCAVHEGVLVIATVCRPNPKLWQNYRVRREKWLEARGSTSSFATLRRIAAALGFELVIEPAVGSNGLVFAAQNGPLRQKPTSDLR